MSQSAAKKPRSVALEAEVVDLVARRKAKFEAMKDTPEQAKLDALTLESSNLTMKGRPNPALIVERDALKDALHADVRALSVEIHEKRLEVLSEKNREDGEALETYDYDQLVVMAGELRAQRRDLARKSRVMARVMRRKRAVKEMTDLWGNLNQEEREALLAAHAAKTAK